MLKKLKNINLNFFIKADSILLSTDSYPTATTTPQYTLKVLEELTTAFSSISSSATEATLENSSALSGTTGVTNNAEFLGK